MLSRGSPVGRALTSQVGDLAIDPGSRQWYKPNVQWCSSITSGHKIQKEEKQVSKYKYCVLLTPVTRRAIGSKLPKIAQRTMTFEVLPKVLQQAVLFQIIYYFARRGRENLYDMRSDHFKVSWENGSRFVEIAVDELDKNHREDNQEDPNPGRMYEQPGIKLFPSLKHFFFRSRS